MASLNQIKSHLRLYRPDFLSYPIYNVTNLLQSGFAGTKMIIYSGTVQGSSNDYKVGARFLQINFLDENLNESKIPITITSRQTKKEFYFFYDHPTWNGNVHLTCSCPDFRFNFQYPLSVRRAWIVTKFIPYIKKTNRPPKNPKNLMGYCKHIHSLLEALTSKGVLR